MATELTTRADALGYEDFGYSGRVDRRQNGGRKGGTLAAEDKTEKLARALGWFSIGLGIAEIAAPRKLAELIGVEDNPTVFRLMGLRELGSGIGILTQARPAGAMWSRVVGDMLDLALLSTQLDSNNPERGKTLTATMSVIGVTALDLFTAKRLGRESNGNSRGSSAVSATRRGVESAGGIKVKRSVTVNRPISEVYGFWRNFENLPRFMTHLKSVQVLDDGRRSHWVVVGPAGKRVEWDAETVEDRPNELISWRSLPGGNVDTSGYVRFKPATGGRGTEILVEMRYDPPGGVIAATIAMLFGESGEQVVTRDLQAFKSVMEVGEVVHSDSSIHHRPHSARPPSDRELAEVKPKGAHSAPGVRAGVRG
jgi:uncharacterized membrane protein